MQNIFKYLNQQITFILQKQLPKVIDHEINSKRMNHLFTNYSFTMLVKSQQQILSSSFCMEPSIITACFWNLETWGNAENQWRSGDTSKYVVSSLHRNIRRSTVFNVFQDNPCIHNILCAYPSNSCGLIGLPYKLLLTPKENYSL